MQDSSQFIEIVFFALLAVFIGLRLRSVLGSRPDEREDDPMTRAPLRPAKNNVVSLVARRPEPEASRRYGNGLDQIAAVDPAFQPDQFLQGARGAFGMIVQAFIQGDSNALRPLLSDEVFGNFSQALRSRLASGEICENRLDDILSADITEAGVRPDGLAFVSVRFVSRQVICQKSQEGQLLFGDPNLAAQITDLWTFARPVRSPDPNWRLVATQSLNA